MCTDCGCGSDSVNINGKAVHSHAPGTDESRKLRIELDVMSKNNNYAQKNRDLFADQQVLAINLLSSPGSGKTTLLTRTLTDLSAAVPMAVIEGDQQTENDAQRIKATGVPAIQINTGKGCHLDAHMVGHALQEFVEINYSILFIENVGNLVCPAEFDLGEAYKVAVLSVTEGEDKPLKYPDMFHAADLLIINKLDLLPYVDFDLDKCMTYARQVNPDIDIITLSATSGYGLDNWYGWLSDRQLELQQQRVQA